MEYLSLSLSPPSLFLSRKVFRLCRVSALFFRMYQIVKEKKIEKRRKREKGKRNGKEG
jgi:hypothetical protein